MTIPGNNYDAAINPAGDGYATLTVTAAGKVQASGKLADGTSFSENSLAFPERAMAVDVPLYSSRGSVLNWKTFQNGLTDEVSRGSGSWYEGRTTAVIIPTVSPT